VNLQRSLATRVLAVLSITVGLVFTAPSAANAVEKVLSVTAYQQENSNWCWAAAAKMIIRYQTGSTIAQCQLVKDGKNSSSCGNVTGTTSNVMNALNKRGVNPGTQVVLSWAYVVSEMDTNRPVYSRIVWRSNGAGHAHVVRGYYNTGYSYGVSYIDPATGSSTSREWGSYANNSSWDIASGTLIHLYRK